MNRSLIEKFKHYFYLEKKSAGKLNIFTLNSPDKATQKLLDELNIKQFNRYAELYLLLWITMSTLLIVNTANGLPN